MKGLNFKRGIMMINACARLSAVFLLMTVLSFPVVAGEPRNVTGSLHEFLSAIDYGTKQDNRWIEPDTATQQLFRYVFFTFLSQEYHLANDAAASIGYEVIRFEDSDSIPPGIHYVLKEKATINDPGFAGGGTYLLYPEGRNVAIEAPHPKTDLYTERQAIELYLTASPRYLALAGTRRDSSTETSLCTGNHSRSDAAHHTNHLFQMAHEEINRIDPETLVIQLHGFGSTSLAKLQGQCRTTSDNLVNLSEGINYRPKRKSGTFTELLKQKINEDGLIKACLYGKDTSSLGGTTNTNGRYTNGSADACHVGADSASHRFIHVEQSYSVRSGNRASINQSIKSAMDAWVVD